MATKKKSPFDVKRVPVPTGKDETHIYEVACLLELPAGLNLVDLQDAIPVWLARGSQGKANVLLEYGRDVKNKTMSMGSIHFRSGLISIGGMKLPRKAKDITVLHFDEKKNNGARA